MSRALFDTTKGDYYYGAIVATGVEGFEGFAFGMIAVTGTIPFGYFLSKNYPSLDCFIFTYLKLTSKFKDQVYPDRSINH